MALSLVQMADKPAVAAVTAALQVWRWRTLGNLRCSLVCNLDAYMRYFCVVHIQRLPGLQPKCPRAVS